MQFRQDQETHVFDDPLLQIIKMIIEKKLPINLCVLIEDATITLNKKVGDNTEACKAFFITRFKNILTDYDITPDIISFLSKQLLKSPLESFNIAKALTTLKQTNNKQYQLILETTTRIHKINQSFKNQATPINPELFEESIEEDIHREFNLIIKNNPTLIISTKQMNNLLDYANF